jgi:hypothetical protein
MSAEHKPPPVDMDRLLVSALDASSQAIALLEIYEAALLLIAWQGTLIAPDEGGKVQRLVDIAQKALTHGR